MTCGNPSSQEFWVNKSGEKEPIGCLCHMSFKAKLKGNQCFLALNVPGKGWSNDLWEMT